MITFLKQLDAKTITSAGGIVVALFLAYVLYEILTNDLSHLNESLQEMNKTQQGVSAVLQGNTEVLRILERRLK